MMMMMMMMMQRFRAVAPRSEIKKDRRTGIDAGKSTSL